MGRLWRTAKGDLVEDGHPEAVSLAYGIGDEVAVEDRPLVRGAKKAAAPKDKRAAKPADKQASGSGLTITRRTDK